MVAPVFAYTSMIQGMSAPIHCPRCNSPYVHRSTRQRKKMIWQGIEKVLSRFGFFPFRCEVCHLRFFAHSQHVHPPD
jgi:hypothetical protein